MKSLYLYVNFFTILIPFIFSFHKKIKFNRHFPAFLKASVIVAIPFILWDAYFTSIGVWGFNDDYTLGFRVLGLPLEEVLFFFCIPFSCLFTYHCLTTFFSFTWTARAEQAVIGMLVVFLFLTGGFFVTHLYTSVTFFILGVLLLLLKYVLKVTWLPKLLSVYLVLLIPFTIVNGILTGTGIEAPVVWYNEAHIIGIRMLTIPFEDIFYGLDLILLNVFFYTRFLARKTA